MKQKVKAHWHFNIPEELVKAKDFTSNEKWVYCVIYGLSYQYGYCWATNEYIATQFGGTSKTVQRAINKLIEHKYLNKTFTRRNRAKYRILMTSESYLYNNKELIHKTMGEKLDKNIELFDYDWLNEDINLSA